ncbi:MAG: AbrB/MazE/SpoVT family DNA-binding domain-containing protein [Candidatus Symbiobacter sp.]|nr:AbrB/MazE/SpoVT family DNA-binding domain-containing protein [Candidatus Symbiobacter sp.]
MQLAKWGNSLAVRIPVPVIQAMDLKEGDEVEINLGSFKKIEAAKGSDQEKRPDAMELLKKLRKYRGLADPGYKFDREDANYRESMAKHYK